MRKHIEELERRSADHVRVTQELENEYEHKLAMELERFDRLSEAMETMRQRCEGLLGSQDDANRAELEALRARGAEEVAALGATIEQLRSVPDSFVPSGVRSFLPSFGSSFVGLLFVRLYVCFLVSS